ncbi:hypothetical protein [Laspinema palackyanum]|uniref:hypothetical protein n=1 Tax=Laspinema palackyanum TaxID=3231601 RepID=UPI00349F6708
MVDGVHVCSNDFSRCSRVVADAITPAIRGSSDGEGTGGLAFVLSLMSWVDGVHVCSNDFSRCSGVMADAITPAIRGSSDRDGTGGLAIAEGVTKADAFVTR